eukprot:TRINITY_DN45412_c0_g1_i1.p1 TRINITY_DN45412_c0_g1~~TRINITY_DN45412_c0_g1_i1.p1  ORF type:complete len:533 (+),score=62.43 TRINITY_DN45412_c0_g1_i1:109-1707(+)
MCLSMDRVVHRPFVIFTSWALAASMVQSSGQRDQQALGQQCSKVITDFDRIDQDGDGCLNRSEFNQIHSYGTHLPASSSQDCGVFFWASRPARGEGQFTNATSFFGNLQRSLEIARAMSPELQLILGYSELIKTNNKSAVPQQISALEKTIVPPFRSINIGSAGKWINELYPNMAKSDKQRMSQTLADYPYPLKAAVWHEATKYCSRLVALDMDVVYFRDIRELLTPLTSEKQILAPPETYTPAYCNGLRRRLKDETAERCIEIGRGGRTPIDPIKVRKAMCNECACADLGGQAEDEYPSISASIMPMGPGALQLLSDKTFLLRYLNITMRLMEGSRPVDKEPSWFSAEFWKRLPQTTGNTPISFPSYEHASPRAKAFIVEQIGYTIAFGCSGIKIGLLDQRYVLPRMYGHDRVLATIAATCHGPVAFHAFNQGFAQALNWFPFWYHHCAPQGAPKLSWTNAAVQRIERGGREVLLTGSIDFEGKKYQLPVYKGEVASDVAGAFAVENDLWAEEIQQVEALVSSWIRRATGA